MDVDSVGRREIEGLNRLLKERERDHTREVDTLQDSYRNKVNDLKDDQRDAIETIQRRVDEQTDDIRKNFDDQLDLNTRHYENKLSEERNKGYDRLGRSTNDTQRELEKEREAMRRQVADYMASSGRAQNLEHEKQDKNAKSLEDAFNKDRVAMKRYLDEKLSSQKEMQREQLAQSATDARDKVDANTRYLNDLMQRQKLGSDIKFQKLAQDSAAEKTQLMRAMKERENQLVDEKTQLAKRAGADGTQEFKDYQNRSEDSLSRILADNHYLNGKKDREHTDRLLEAEQSHQRELQDMRSRFNQATDLLRAQKELEKTRKDINMTVAERRKSQQAQLEQEAARKNSNLAQENLRSSYSEKLRDAEEKTQRLLNERTNDLKSQMRKNDAQTQAEQNSLTQDIAGQLGEAFQKHTREKETLVRSYQEKQDALDELRKRQLEAQKQALGREVQDTKADANRAITENTLENQQKLYMMQQSLRNTTNELTSNRKNDLDFANASYNQRVSRLTDTYHRAILQQKDNFDQATDELRHENKLQMYKLHSDSEHDLRTQAHELQTKNRILMLSFETQLNALKDQHTAEMDKLKLDNERAMRNLLKKTKETVDQERVQTNRALAAKDQQMNDRLKLQEEQFKAEVDKLKRTNELALKKS